MVSPTMPKSVTPSMPANTAVPSVRRISAPAPSETISGTTPQMKANDVMTLASVQRSEELLNGMQLVLHPFKTARLEYRIRVPKHPGLKQDYQDNFEKNVKPIVQQLKDRYNIHIPGVANLQDDGQAFHFDKTFALAPRETRDKLAHTILGSTSVELQFYKPPIDICTFR